MSSAVSHTGKFSGVIGEVETLIFDFTEDLAIRREASYEYGLNEFITLGAFTYECTNAGKTAADAPEFTKVIGATVDDGSVEWTCRDYSANGTDTISTHIVTADSSLTVNTSDIQKSTRVAIEITLDELGVHHLSCEVVTANTQKHKSSVDVVVKVR